MFLASVGTLLTAFIKAQRTASDVSYVYGWSHMMLLTGCIAHNRIDTWPPARACRLTRCLSGLASPMPLSAFPSGLPSLAEGASAISQS